MTMFCSLLLSWHSLALARASPPLFRPPEDFKTEQTILFWIFFLTLYFCCCSFSFLLFFYIQTASYCIHVVECLYLLLDMYIMLILCVFYVLLWRGVRGHAAWMRINDYGMLPRNDLCQYNMHVFVSLIVPLSSSTYTTTRESYQ